MACDPTASGFETAEGKVAIPELLPVTAGWSAPSTVKTTDPTGHERSRCSQDRSTHRGGIEGRRGYIQRGGGRDGLPRSSAQLQRLRKACIQSVVGNAGRSGDAVGCRGQEVHNECAACTRRQRGRLRPRTQLRAATAAVVGKTCRDVGILTGDRRAESERRVADVCHRYCLIAGRAYLRAGKCESARRDIHYLHAAARAVKRVSAHDVKVAGAVDRQTSGNQLRARGRPTDASRTIAGHGSDDSLGIYHAGNVVGSIYDMQVARTVDRYA